LNIFNPYGDEGRGGSRGLGYWGETNQLPLLSPLLRGDKGGFALCPLPFSN